MKESENSVSKVKTPKDTTGMELVFTKTITLRNGKVLRHPTNSFRVLGLSPDA